MRELEVTNLYENMDERAADDFASKLNSNMNVKTEFYKEQNDLEWIFEFEKILPYIEKILRNPKRFITTEEEIVKIESAKKVGVETVKHLAKHTNFVQDIDEDTGDVIPAKLLNVLKEETFNTYENRFIYTLIHRMQDFIRKKKENIIPTPRLKDNKKIDYSSTTSIGEEKINVSIQLSTALDTKTNLEKGYEERIKKIENSIKDLMFTEVYKSLDKEGVALVTPPIKKTNVILKNVNFQYAMELWDYVNLNITKKDKPINTHKDYEEKGFIRNYIDETFLLEYLTVSNINKDEEEFIQNKEKAMAKLLDKIIDMNPELTKKELQDKLGVEFDKAMQRKQATKKDIEKIFRKYLEKYLEKEFIKV